MYRLYRLHRKSDKHINLKRARGTSPLLKKVRRSNYPTVISGIRERGVVSRTRQAPVLARRPFTPRPPSRFPIIGLRSVREDKWSGGQTDPGRILREIKDSLTQIPGVRSVCQARGLRRRILFGSRVAGRNIRRSPGRGGTYRRTADSSTTCEKVKK